MILMTITINSTDYQVSTRQLALETPWHDDVIDAGNVNYQMRSKHGGFVEPSFGEIELKPGLFTVANWPPPASCAVKIEYTTTTEAAAEELFQGTGQLKSFNRDGVKYELHPDEYDSYLNASTAISDTLNDVFTTYTGASYLNLTLNTAYARSSSPAVSYTTSSKQPTLDVLSDIAKFFSHLFYIRGTTLYLVDMLLTNGSDEAITEFDFYPADYEMDKPYSLFKTDDDSVEGSYPYGTEFNLTPVCHGTQANRETALGDIKTILERYRAVTEKDLETSNLPVPGMKITFEDASTVHTIDVELYARNLTFDFSTEDVVIEGDCEITIGGAGATVTTEGGDTITTEGGTTIVTEN